VWGGRPPVVRKKTKQRPVEKYGIHEPTGPDGIYPLLRGIVERNPFRRVRVRVRPGTGPLEEVAVARGQVPRGKEQACIGRINEKAKGRPVASKRARINRRGPACGAVCKKREVFTLDCRPRPGDLPFTRGELLPREGTGHRL